MPNFPSDVNSQLSALVRTDKKGEFVNRRNALMIAGGLLVGSRVGFAEIPSPPPEPCPPPLTLTPFITSDIAANHGHLLILPADALPGIYTIQGRSGHAHTVEITESVLTQLMGNGSFDLQSSTAGGHVHAVRLLAAQA